MLMQIACIVIALATSDLHVMAMTKQQAVSTVSRVLEDNHMYVAAQASLSS